MYHPGPREESPARSARAPQEAIALSCPPFVLASPLLEGRFLRRLNRFVVEAELRGEPVRAHLPNPGRLLELLVPGNPLWLTPSRGTLPYRALGVRRMDAFVPLDTLRANDAAEHLLRHRRIPGLEDAALVRREVPVGESRFDFLLRRGDTPFLLEVKCCTLFDRRLALFPDAPSERGRRHLDHLGELAASGQPCGVLFLVQAPIPRAFLPDWHTDLPFASSLFAARDRGVEVFAPSVSWDDGFRLSPEVRPLPVPWEAGRREARDRGAYLLVLELPQEEILALGPLGKRLLPGGFYVAVGFAPEGLEARLARHRRKVRIPRDPLEALLQRCRVVRDLPVRGTRDRTADLTARIAPLAEEPVRFEAPEGGDLRLFRFASDPSREGPVFETVLDLRTQLPEGPE